VVDDDDEVGVAGELAGLVDTAVGIRRRRR
jgi:hypothetical protein